MTDTKPLTKAELLEVLKTCLLIEDPEGAHYEAGQALLDYINDPDIRAAYTRIEKWYREVI